MTRGRVAVWIPPWQACGSGFLSCLQRFGPKQDQSERVSFQMATEKVEHGSEDAAGDYKLLLFSEDRLVDLRDLRSKHYFTNAKRRCLHRQSLNQLESHRCHPVGCA